MVFLMITRYGLNSRIPRKQHPYEKKNDWTVSPVEIKSRLNFFCWDILQILAHNCICYFPYLQ